MTEFGAKQTEVAEKVRHNDNTTTRLNVFARDEEGGITLFVLVILVMLLVVGGMSVDFMRHEMMRADLQNALDRGVLAATNSNQFYDPDAEDSVDDQAQTVVEEYLRSRQFTNTDLDIRANVQQLAGGRSVNATADFPMDTIFLRLMGLNNIDVTAAAGALQAAPKQEITLVLDVSGSMGRAATGAPGSKLDQLKDAAQEFIDTILTAENGAQTAISIIPFSAQVALPRSMADLYNFNRFVDSTGAVNDFSSCFDYDSLEDDFDTTAMPMQPTVAYDQHHHFIERTRNGENVYGCPHIDNAILPFSSNAGELKAAIENLRLEHLTSTFMGTKWAAALLDPSSRPIMDARIAANKIDSDFADWPHEWDDPSVHKVTVIMTDGRNTTLREIKDHKYDDHPLAHWDQNRPENGDFRNKTGTNSGDQHLKEICDQLKPATSANTIANSTVYTIGFELEGQDTAIAALEDCATNLTTFYLVEGVEIAAAFQNIADDIVNLQLIN